METTAVLVPWTCPRPQEMALAAVVAVTPTQVAAALAPMVAWALTVAQVAPMAAWATRISPEEQARLETQHLRCPGIDDTPMTDHGHAASGVVVDDSLQGSEHRIAKRRKIDELIEGPVDDLSHYLYTTPPREHVLQQQMQQLLQQLGHEREALGPLGSRTWYFKYLNMNTFRIARTSHILVYAH